MPELRKLGSAPQLPPYAFMERCLMTVTFVDRNMRVVAGDASSLSYPAISLPVMEVKGFCIIAGLESV